MRQSVGQRRVTRPAPRHVSAQKVYVHQLTRRTLSFSGALLRCVANHHSIARNEPCHRNKRGAIRCLRRDWTAPSTDENAVSPAKDASTTEAMYFNNNPKCTKHAKQALSTAGGFGADRRVPVKLRTSDAVREAIGERRVARSPPRRNQRGATHTLIVSAALCVVPKDPTTRLTLRAPSPASTRHPLRCSVRRQKRTGLKPLSAATSTAPVAAGKYLCSYVSTPRDGVTVSTTTSRLCGNPATTPRAISPLRHVTPASADGDTVRRTAQTA